MTSATDHAPSFPLDIFLVEDNPADALLVEEALDTQKVAFLMRTIEDGASALAALRACADAGQLPDLVLLDGDLPGLTGLEVLAAIRSDAALEQLPVVMFSGSSTERTIRRAYRGHVSAYVRKPGDFKGYVTVIGDIHRFWSEVAALPRSA